MPRLARPCRAMPALPRLFTPRLDRPDRSLPWLLVRALPVPCLPCHACRAIDRLNDPRPACNALPDLASPVHVGPRQACKSVPRRAKPNRTMPRLRCLQIHAVPDGGFTRPAVAPHLPQTELALPASASLCAHDLSCCHHLWRHAQDHAMQPALAQYVDKQP